jgi:pimeloyl-ACP methyl ester carboxylesterase
MVAAEYPKGLAAIMLTSSGRIPYMGDGAPPLTPEELEWQGRWAANNAREGAYQALQATKPQSLAYGHYDSPIALACWVIEKFQAWTIPGSTQDPPMPMDDLVANVMLYWLNGALSPMWLYMSLGELAQPASTNQRVLVPAGFLFGPGDLMPPAPRSWLERSFNIARVTEAKKGGHFPGLDDPGLLVAEIRALFSRFR